MDKYDEITWDDYADALFEERKKGTYMQLACVNFDPEMSFDSVDQCIAFCEKQPEPIAALKAIVCANIDMGEFGFASEVVLECQTMAVCCPDVLPKNR